MVNFNNDDIHGIGDLGSGFEAARRASEKEMDVENYSSNNNHGKETEKQISDVSGKII